MSGISTGVQDKTGYSLTAGSYVVRASSCQHAATSLATGTDETVTATISSVTTTRTILLAGDYRSVSDTGADSQATHVLTNATTITYDRDRTTNAGGSAYATSVQELF